MKTFKAHHNNNPNSAIGLKATYGYLVIPHLISWVLALILQLLATQAIASTLTIDDGVVVKFGADAQLKVRENIATGKGIVLTSHKDDQALGMLGVNPQTPQAGDWLGLSLEKTAYQGYGGAKLLSGLTIRYGGGNVNNKPSAALTLVGVSASLQNLIISDSSIGLKVLEGAAPVISGASFLRNATGIEASASALNISQSQLYGNKNLAIDNKTPDTVISALSNWWGHATGPKEPVGNPSGQGDTITTGVDYGNFKSALSLSNGSVYLAEPAAYFEQHDIALELYCMNAAEYRIAEGNSFDNAVPKPLADGRANATFATSDGDGVKQIKVQFRGPNNTTVVVPLDDGVLIDTKPPNIQLSNPANGSLISQPITVTAAANDEGGMGYVEFYVDDALVGTKGSAPYTFGWNTYPYADGGHQLKVVAIDKAGRKSEQVANVTLTKIVPAADVLGPTIYTLMVEGVQLSNGITLQHTTTIRFNATDPSGVTLGKLSFDGTSVATEVGRGFYGFEAIVNLDNVENGPHTIELQAIDSLGNLTIKSFNITVAHAPPIAPVIYQPASGISVGTKAIDVSGSAKAGSSVQIYNNTEAVGSPISVGADGRFTANLSLVKGNNMIQARATDQYGTGPASIPRYITLDSSIPSQPKNLTASAQAGGKVKLSWLSALDSNTVGYDIYRSSSAFDEVNSATKVGSAGLSPTADDLPPQDGNWYYRVVALNKAKTASQPSNIAQVVTDNILPRALSINYAPQGSFDPDKGLVGQGTVNLVLTTSEDLPSPPFLSIAPLGGTPMPITLTQSSPKTYTGSFVVGPNTPPGPANAIFSARDAVGNQGTEIDNGAVIKLDTAGPALSGIALEPGSPINSGESQNIEATFTFSKPPKAAPLINVMLSGAGRVAIPLTSLTKEDATTWTGSFTLPDDAGQAKPEMLSFSFTAIDALNNESTKVLATNNFQVYKNNLPPLDVPFALSAKAQPNGKVKLSWQAVDAAISYQLYRQAPGQGELLPLFRATGTDYLDHTEQDGNYHYAVASVRLANSQEAVSAQSQPVSVIASATAPEAPRDLALRLSGQGVVATWQAPVQGTVASYNLYREPGASISDIEGMAPIKTGIKQLTAIDATPMPDQGAYVVTALDAAGNESAISNSAYLNIKLLPVKRLEVSQANAGLPNISWSASNRDITQFKVYASTGGANDKAPLTLNPLVNDLAYTDFGYNGGTRNYTVATVDANGVEMPRSLLLPSITAHITDGLPIQRGVMNLLQVQVANQSDHVLKNVRAVIKLPTDKQTTTFKDHYSQPITIEAGQSRILPLVVGGYAGLPDTTQAQIRVEIAPSEGELVKITQDQEISVSQGSLVVGMSTSDFTRGATGKIKLNIENTTDTEVELLTATQSGQAESTDLRFIILDKDGNVLATQPYKQALGANVLSLPSGHTVARIAPGTSYVSDEFLLNIPSASPPDIRVKLEVDKIRYHTGQPDEIAVTGMGAERTVSLLDTAYSGEVTDAQPTNSYGDQDIIIKGRALDRASNKPLPNSRLKLVLNQEGFERVLAVQTDTAGNFTHVYKPTYSDTGLYKVSAVHPDMTDRPEQKTFTINRITAGPNPIQVDIPKNYPITLPITAKSGLGSVATNLTLNYTALAQPTGLLPAGIDVKMPLPVNLAGRQTVELPVIFSANNDAQQSGSLIFDVVSDEYKDAPLGQVRVDYKLTEAKPFLVRQPNFIETGLASGESQVESVKIENKGLKEAENLVFKLTNENGGSAPSWVNIANQSNGNLPVGENVIVDLSFTPPEGTSLGIYKFKLNIKGDNIDPQNINIFANLTESGQGNVLFKLSDIYTATKDKNGKLIQGLAGATVTVQNEDVATINQELVSDSVGEAFFRDLPAGRYKFRAKAVGHQEIGGRLTVKPGITVNQPVFLQYNLITVEWSVREITLQDRYDIILNTTFETDVPAPVVLLEPASINLPKMATGEVFYGELNLTNYGLIRAEKITQQLPKEDGYFRYEFLVDMPTALEPKQRVTLPYRIIALKDIETMASAATASGGGCYNYSNKLNAPYKFQCANGTESEGSASASWFSSSNSTCPTTQTTGYHFSYPIGTRFGWGGGSGGAGGGGGGGYSSLPMGPVCGSPPKGKGDGDGDEKKPCP